MYIVTWGNNHSKSFNNYNDAKNFAYDKGFYFTVEINGKVYDRPF